MYKVSENQKKRFAGLYLLEYIINKPRAFSLFLENDESDLEPILEYLMVEEWIQIHENSKYVPTVEGRLELKSFIGRYRSYLQQFDVYSCVDLERGEFAFKFWDDFENEERWDEFLQDDRWEDLRIAVAEFLGMDPIEIVFMSFVSEDRFGRTDTGWQFDLLLGTVWNTILEVCNQSLHMDDLGYESEGRRIEGESVIRDVYMQGKLLMDDLMSENETEFSDEIYKGEDPGDSEHYVDPVGM
jgi:hypothetical protein|tara:strand:+ start:41 stop:766 length:726 start_codon:yes stop_codon:yes gene_type:complete